MSTSSYLLASRKKIAQHEPQIRAWPNSTFSSAQIKRLGIGCDDNLTRWAETLGIPMHNVTKNGRGYSFWVEKKDLLSQLEQASAPPSTEEKTMPSNAPDTFFNLRKEIFNALVSAPVANQFEKFQRDFAATIDALYNEMQEGARQQREANRILFKKLVDIEEKVTALVKEWG